jgi:hypothetical protein
MRYSAKSGKNEIKVVISKKSGGENVKELGLGCENSARISSRVISV